MIRDTGVGISKEDLPHVFERFYRATDTNTIGSGIGLALVDRIAELSGLSISLESEVGVGTTFRISQS